MALDAFQIVIAAIAVISILIAVAFKTENSIFVIFAGIALFPFALFLWGESGEIWLTTITFGMGMLFIVLGAFDIRS